MQKLAVALTTQEEFNEYMKYAEKMWRKRRAWNIPMEYWSREDFWPSTYMFFWDGFYYVTKDEWYKIISLQEAIGEKEDKEIIREEEARGFEPKTGDRVRLSNSFADFPEWEYNYNETTWYYVRTNHVYWSDCTTHCIHKDIVNWMKYHFEPIEEPKREWRIHKAYDYFENDTRCMMWWPNGRELFFEAIEKHMPRISKEEVKDICGHKACFKTFASYSKIIDLLESKWLLE